MPVSKNRMNVKFVGKRERYVTFHSFMAPLRSVWPKQRVKLTFAGDQSRRKLIVFRIPDLKWVDKLNLAGKNHANRSRGKDWKDQVFHCNLKLSNLDDEDKKLRKTWRKRRRKNSSSKANVVFVFVVVVISVWLHLDRSEGVCCVRQLTSNFYCTYIFFLGGSRKGN